MRTDLSRAHGGEQERPGPGEAEQILAPHEPAGSLAIDLLRHMTLVEGTRGNEATALRYGLRPHAAPTQAQLLEGRLDARVEDGIGHTIEREAQCEERDCETPTWHADGARRPESMSFRGSRALDVANRVRTVSLMAHCSIRDHAYSVCYQAPCGCRRTDGTMQAMVDTAAHEFAYASYWFYWHEEIASVTVMGILSGAREMQRTFNSREGLTEIDLSGLDPSSFEDLAYTFGRCDSFVTTWADAD